MGHTNPNVWTARYNHMPGIGSFPSINPLAANSLFVAKLTATADEAGVDLADCGLVAMHQPNPDLVRRVDATLRARAPSGVLDIAAAYGNLVCNSAATDPCEAGTARPPGRSPTATGVFIFALGADAGMTYGACLMRHRVAA